MRQENCEFKTRLSYIVSFRLAWATVRLYLENKTKRDETNNLVWECSVVWCVECLLSMREAPGSILGTKITTVTSQGSWKENPMHSLEKLLTAKQPCWAGTQDGDLTDPSCYGIGESCPLTLSSQSQPGNRDAAQP